MTRSFALVFALLVLAGLALVGLVFALTVLPFPDVAGLVVASAVVASTKSVLAFRPFEKADWYGWGGATASPDGRAPMIGEYDGAGYGEYPATVIADACGVEVTLYGDDGSTDEPTTAVFRYDTDAGSVDSGVGTVRGYAMAVFLASSLPFPLTPAYLEGIGFADVSP